MGSFFSRTNSSDPDANKAGAKNEGDQTSAPSSSTDQSPTEETEAIKKMAEENSKLATQLNEFQVRILSN